MKKRFVVGKKGSTASSFFFFFFEGSQPHPPTRTPALASPPRLCLARHRPTSPPALSLPFSRLAAPAFDRSARIPHPPIPFASHPSLSSRGSSLRYVRRLIQATSGESHHHEAQPEASLELAAPSHTTRSGARGQQRSPATLLPWLGFRASAPAPVGGGHVALFSAGVRGGTAARFDPIISPVFSTYGEWYFWTILLRDLQLDFWSKVCELTPDQILTIRGNKGVLSNSSGGQGGAKGV